MKRLRFLIFASFFAAYSILVPITATAQAAQGVTYAAVRAAFAEAYGGATGGATAVTEAAAALNPLAAGGVVLGALAIGAIVYYVSLQTNNGTTLLLPKAEGDSLQSLYSGMAATGGGTSAASSSASYYYIYSYQGATPAAACSSWAAGTGGASGVVTATTPNSGVCSGYRSDRTVYSSQYIYASNLTYSCPSGATANGSGSSMTCTTPAGCPTGYQLYPDGRCYIPATSASQPGQLPQTQGYVEPDMSGGWKPITGSAPTSNIPATPLPVQSGGTDPQTMQPNQSVQVTSNPDGSITVTAKNYNSASQQTSTQQTVISPSGAVSAQNSSTATGNQTMTGSSTPSVSINLPTDYARDATVAAGTKAFVDDSTAAQTAAAGQVAQAAAESGVFSDASRWTVGGLGLPTKDQFQAPDTTHITDAIPQDSDCVPVQIQVLSATANLNFCPLVQLVKPILNWVVLTMFAVSTARYVLGRREES